MRFLILFVFAGTLAACGAQPGQPLYKNPPPAPATDIQGGQPHTDCPSGLTVC